MLSDIRIQITDPNYPGGAYNWCREQFGPPSSWLQCEGWRKQSTEFTFYNSQDAMLFLLRWQGEVIRD